MLIYLSESPAFKAFNDAALKGPLFWVNETQQGTGKDIIIAVTDHRSPRGPGYSGGLRAFLDITALSIIRSCQIEVNGVVFKFANQRKFLPR